MERIHKVNVWDKPCEVSVHKKSASVWVASGTYLGEVVQVEDRSEMSAVKRWREAATYKGG